MNKWLARGILIFIILFLIFSVVYSFVSVDIVGLVVIGRITLITTIGIFVIFGIALCIYHLLKWTGWFGL